MVAVISVHADPLAVLGSGQNGGMNLTVRRLCSSLSEMGVATDVLTRLSASGQASVQPIAPMSRVLRLPAGPLQTLAAAEAVDHVSELVTSIDDHANHAGVDYRVIHAHHWVSGLVAERLSRLWGVPWAQSFHTLAKTKREGRYAVEPGRELIESRLCRDADHLVAVSQSEARDLVEFYAVDPQRIDVVEPGADRSITTPCRVAEMRALLDLTGKRVILFAGRLDPLKDIDTLLGATAGLAMREGYADVVTLLAGDDAVDGERERLTAQAHARGIGDRVHFLGSVDHDDLIDYYSLADVCVVPSRIESFGLVALEAQAAGTPVVAADVGGLREIVVHGKTGFLVAPGDVTGFCRQIARVLDDVELRSHLGDAARRRAAAFTWARGSARLDSVYARLEAAG